MCEENISFATRLRLVLFQCLVFSLIVVSSSTPTPSGLGPAAGLSQAVWSRTVENLTLYQQNINSFWGFQALPL